MTRSVLILLIIAAAVFIGFQILGKYRGRVAQGPEGALGPSSAYAAAATRQGTNGGQDLMANLRREIKALQAAAGEPSGEGPQAHVVRSLTLISAKLSEMDRRLHTLEQRAAREDHRLKMLEK
jgi:hypothetical protein